MTIFDTNRNVTRRLGQLPAGSSICRYIDAINFRNEKVIKPDEARAIAAAGHRLWLVYEIGGKPSGSAIGNRDGEFTMRWAPTVGAVPDSPLPPVIYYTVDYDAQAGDMSGIVAAFTAFRSVVYPHYRVGCYASGFVNRVLFQRGLVEKRWLTCSGGFMGTREAISSGAYDIRQRLPSTVAGLDADIDELHDATAEFGDFVPFQPWSGSPPVTPPAPELYRQDGQASWYDDHETASGEPFDSAKLTAAHRGLPFGTMAKVTRKDDGTSIVVKINDRGPYYDKANRIIDLTRAGAEALHMIDEGVADVQVEELPK